MEEYHDLEKGFSAAGYNIYGYRGHNTYSGGMFVDDNTLSYVYKRHSINVNSENRNRLLN